MGLAGDRAEGQRYAAGGVAQGLGRIGPDWIELDWTRWKALLFLSCKSTVCVSIFSRTWTLEVNLGRDDRLISKSKSYHH